MDALFLPATDGGRRFAVLREPADVPVHAAILYVHPFAEEMNKTRRMAALQAKDFCQLGLVVLQLDLAGCGDSSGEFEDATWAGWIDDVVAAATWLSKRHPLAPLCLWGARAGCLLVADAARRLPTPPIQLWWTPVQQGRTQLSQFLRIRTAANMLQGAEKLDAKAELAAGRTVEVAGYRLPSAIAEGMAHARLDAPLAAQHLIWIDVDNRTDGDLSPATAKLLADIRATATSVHHARVPGPSFWQTTEIEEAPALLDATTRAVAAFIQPGRA